MTFSDASELGVQLLDGEKVLWTGNPATGLGFTSSDWFLVPFSFLWCGFAIFWEWSVAHAPKSPLFMKLWGATFVLIGLFFVAGRFLVDIYLRTCTRYALTNTRVLIVRSGLAPKLTALNLSRLQDVNLTERANGTGTVRFGPEQLYRYGRGFSMMPALDPTPQFLWVADARAVFEQIQRIAKDL